MQGFQEEDFTKRFDLSLWKKLLIIAKPFHRDLIFVAVLMGMSALVDVLLPLMNAYAIDNYIARQSTAGLECSSRSMWVCWLFRCSSSGRFCACADGSK